MSKDIPHRDSSKNNVIELFSGKNFSQQRENHVIRISPEFDEIEMLYSNDVNPDKLFSMKILCWAMDSSGDIDAMVPWLTRLVRCKHLNDPLNGRWEGYLDKQHNRILYEPPLHKIIELESSADYFSEGSLPDASLVIQEIPDHIGTHATFTDKEKQNMILDEVVSWRLMGDGHMDAMVADFEKASFSPILAGDPCLYSTRNRDDFCYYFHHSIANRIKTGDPEVMNAFNRLNEE